MTDLPAAGETQEASQALGDGLSLAAFADLLPDAIVICDRQGTIVHANSVAEELFRYGSGELAGLAVEELLPEQLRALHREHRAGYIAAPRTRRMGTGMPLQARRRDGTTFPADISLTAAGPGASRVFTAIRDASTRLEAEREWRVHEAVGGEGRMQQSLRLESLGRLAGGMAHDFNNLLAAILISAELALDGDEIDPRQALREIRAAASRAAEFTRRALVLGREAPDNPEPTAVGAVVEDLRSLLDRTIEASVEIEVEIEDAPGQVMVDRSQLEQVILNLAINARDAMPEGGTLRICTKIREMESSVAAISPSMTPGRYLQLVVEDTGSGMDPDQIERAFEPFYTTKSEGEGTGLGLSLAYGVVRRAGGHIGIYSEPGSGTAVKIYLPLLERLEDAGEEQEPEPAPIDESLLGHGEQVMVVEDQPGLAGLAGHLLSAHGYAARVAGSAEEALSIIVREGADVDAMLCDLVLPRASGVVLAERLREAGVEIPIVFMSGYTAKRRDDPPNILVKPFQRDELLGRVKDALASAGD